MSELLESRWQDTKVALLEGLQGNKKATMASTLENTRKWLNETATAGSTSAGNVATLNRVILPVIRRVMPTVITACISHVCACEIHVIHVYVHVRHICRYIYRCAYMHLFMYVHGIY